jgi:hypothetical protein
MSYPGIAGPELGDTAFVRGLAAPLQAVVRDAAAGPHPRIVADVARRAGA